MRKSMGSWFADSAMVGIGSSATTSRNPSPITYTMLQETTYTASIPRLRSANTSPPYRSKRDVRHPGTAGYA